MKLYVQYGCGMSAPPGWRNFDASPTLRFERIPIIGRLYTKNARRFPDAVEYGDIVRGLPIEPRSCDGVYCSHILEHLALTDLRTALKQTYELLKDGGTFRLVVPDLETLAQRYLNAKTSVAALDFMRDSGLGVERRLRGLPGFAKAWLGNAVHLWMWDYPSLALELRNIGFCEVRRAVPGDSRDVAFLAVEDQSRWQECLGIEARRPSTSAGAIGESGR